MPQGYTLIIPEEDDRYMVTESQLEVLEKAGKDTALEWALFLGGAALGLLPSLGGTINTINNGKTPSVFDLFLAVLFILFVGYGFARLREHRSRKIDTSVLVQKIKSGQRLSVGYKREV